MRRLLAVPLFALSIAAGGDEPSPSDAAAAMLDDAKFDVKVTLVSPGEGARSAIVWHPKPGASATWESVATTKSDMSMRMPGVAEPIPMPMPMPPSVITTTRHTVGAPQKGGVIPVRIEQLGSRIEGGDPMMQDAMKDALAKSKLTLDLLIGPDGRLQQTDVSGVDPAMATAMQQVVDQVTLQSAMFPNEAVGVGAKWTVDMSMSMSGLQLHLVQHCTLDQVSPTSADLSFQMELDLLEGKMALPGMPPDASVEIRRFDGSGYGNSHADLTTLVTTGTTTMDMNMDMGMSMPEGAMEISTKMHQVTLMRPAK